MVKCWIHVKSQEWSTKSTSRLKKGKKEQEAKSKEEEKTAELSSDKKEEEIKIESKTFSIKTKLKIADNIVAEGNKLLKARTVKMVQAIFNQGQEKVEVGLKRRK